MRVKTGTKEVVLENRPNGTFLVDAGYFKAIIQIRAKTPAEKFESVRMVIIQNGLVFTEKLEKNVRKELNYWS
jgi:hypothetical protein